MLHMGVAGHDGARMRGGLLNQRHLELIDTVQHRQDALAVVQAAYRCSLVYPAAAGVHLPGRVFADPGEKVRFNLKQEAAFLYIKREVGGNHVPNQPQLREDGLPDRHRKNLLFNQHHGVRQVHFDKLVKLTFLGLKCRNIMVLDHAFSGRSTQASVG